MWALIQQRIRGFRTLPEVIEDAKIWITKPWTNLKRSKSTVNYLNLTFKLKQHTYIHLFICRNILQCQNNPCGLILYFVNNNGPKFQKNFQVYTWLVYKWKDLSISHISDDNRKTI